MATWRLMLPIDGPGAYHMAADTALLESIRDGQSGPILRFYHWTPPCVTLGKFQPAEGNVHLENCARLGIDVVKRPTGGRAIFHDHEVTFSIIIAEKDLPEAGTSIMDSYRALGVALVDGLQRLGVPAQLVDYHAKTRSADPASVTATGNPACFAAKARCDLMAHDRKIIGSAQLRKSGIILQQNSLPLSVDFSRWEEVFFRSDWQMVSDTGAIDLWSAAGREVSYDAVVDAMCAGFTNALGAELVPSVMTAREDARTKEIMPEYSVLRAQE